MSTPFDALTPIPENSIALLIITGIIAAFLGSSAKYLFEQFLPQWRIKREKRLAIQKYAFPLWRSSNHLRIFLHTILFTNEDDWGNKPNHEYRKLKTLYLFGTFFGWCRNVGDENLVEYMELDPKINTSYLKEFTIHFNGIYRSISNIDYFMKIADLNHDISEAEIDESRIPALVLACIGELMIDKKNSKETYTKTISFLEFTNLYSQDGEFKKWFDYVDRLFTNFKKEKMNMMWNRLILFYFYLYGFEVFLRETNIDFLSVKNPIKVLKFALIGKARSKEKIGKRKIIVKIHPGIVDQLNNDENLGHLNYYFKNP